MENGANGRYFGVFGHTTSTFVAKMDTSTTEDLFEMEDGSVIFGAITLPWSALDEEDTNTSGVTLFNAETRDDTDEDMTDPIFDDNVTASSLPMEQTEQTRDDTDEDMTDPIFDDNVTASSLQMEQTEQECQFDLLKCQYCSKVYCSLKTLNRHLKTHSNVSLQCNQCPKTFKTEGLLKQHVKRHGQSYLCAECAGQFTSVSNLSRHMQQKHTQPSKHKCPVCFQSLSSTLRLNEHVQKHLDLDSVRKNSFECKKCAKSFVSKCSYKRHLKLANCDVKRQQLMLHCEICAKSFASRKYLNQHQKVHEKPRFICSYCGKEFAWKNCLDIHLKQCEK